VAFLLLAALGEPLFVTIGIVTLLLFNVVAAGAGSVVDTSTPVILAISELTKSEVLISIPLFTLAGTIMTRGGISPRLIAVARALTGWLPGGLAMSCVVACTFFAAISGSSSVTIIAIGGMLYPALKKEGYGERFALGLITICGAIGTLIPPSLPLIVYGVIASNAVLVEKESGRASSPSPPSASTRR
jgi:C4-dicarboxylate transporter DctM subunit